MFWALSSCRLSTENVWYQADFESYVAKRGIMFMFATLDKIIMYFDKATYDDFDNGQR